MGRALTPTQAERKIENAVSKYAESKGWLAFKFVSPGESGVPDHQYMQHGWMFFIEFKAPGEEPDERQLYQHRRIQTKGGHIVFIVDNIEQGRYAIDQMTERLVQVKRAVLQKRLEEAS